ncbi:DNA utilization protein GntX [Enterobacteriaceae bacterium H20N1]|uniref:DNA utilization protein GntX n=1 Tax=Dryocola boscaweniae TaxID=2925397 RepID=A0A9X3AQQ8_9ENTR|nr:DNA utilization protein GntX [Dryocola boscaweniae]MCT4703445.1 DNA utilization protein GntX [Dryocola boscaweniae]MCT4720613.1 DNA utilization protein GntX [Dryocola boscaweniae]
MLTIPGLCWLCRMPLACPTWGFCSRCVSALPAPPPACPRCGLPAAPGVSQCGRCLQEPPPWDRLIFVTDYRLPLNALVHRLKFTAATALAPALARLILLKIIAAKRVGSVPKPEAIVSVPLHSRRAWRRGFNQSALLATPLAHWLQCEYQDAFVRRVRATATQHELSAKLRRGNLKGAFRVEFPAAGRHMVIVDDVVTTGSTVAEIARLLKKQGAATVQVWCLCRTL